MKTRDLSKLGTIERAEVQRIFDAWNKYGLPDGYGYSEIAIEFDQSTGDVYLINEHDQCCMVAGSSLETFYKTPYGGYTGFFDDLASDYSTLCDEDKLYVENIAYELGRKDELR